MTKEIELTKSICFFVQGTLSDNEIQKLLDEMTAAPEWFDYYLTEYWINQLINTSKVIL